MTSTTGSAKTVLFCPGFGENLKSRNYGAVLDIFKYTGHKTKFVPIKWPRLTMDDYVSQLLAEYEKHDPSQTILAGFSLGAFASFVVAAERSPSQLWLFSLSPYFAEDLPLLPKSWVGGLGHRRVDAFAKFRFKSLAPKISSKTFLFFGEQEIAKPSQQRLRHNELSRDKAIKDARQVLIPDVGHNVTHPSYLAAVKKAIKATSIIE